MFAENIVFFPYPRETAFTPLQFKKKSPKYVICQGVSKPPHSTVTIDYCYYAVLLIDSQNCPQWPPRDFKVIAAT